MKLLLFYTDTVICKNVIKILNSNSIKYKAIDVTNSDNSKLLEKYNIVIAPTLIKLDNNYEIGRLIGNLSKNTLEAWLK